MLLFTFSYGLDCCCYDPCSPTFHIEAESLEAATTIAQAKFDAFLFDENCEKWRREDSGHGFQWVHYPATNRTGYLRKGREHKPIKLNTRPTVWPKWDEKMAEAIAAVVSQPMLQVIEQAPIFAKRLAGPLPEMNKNDFSIPLTICGETVYEPPPGWKS